MVRHGQPEKSPGLVVIQEAREDIRRIASAHGAGNVRVFGSTGRGEQSAMALRNCSGAAEQLWDDLAGLLASLGGDSL
jgi:hypothetical protein